METTSQRPGRWFHTVKAAMNRDNYRRPGESSTRGRFRNNDVRDGRREPSGAWSRLRPAVIDPLDMYGLPSKGEMRLHDHSNQEAYYAKIVERYMKFCAATGGGEPLEAAFASLALSGPPQEEHQSGQRPSLPHRPSATERPNDLPNIHLAMRKLREGILGSRRCDVFAQRAYIFIIHASILTKQWEAYQPALLHLLSTIHPQTPLSPIELREFVMYLVWDLACRQGELSEAMVMRRKYGHKDHRTTVLLSCIIRDDWPRFWRLKRAVDGYQRCLMTFVEGQIRKHALKCIARSYMNVQRTYLERVGDMTFAELVEEIGLGWQLQPDETVMVRKPKSK